MCAADFFNAWKRRELREKLVKKWNLVGVGVTFIGQGDIELDSLPCVKTRFDGEHIDHASNE